jgi:HEPN domain-containing protein
MNPLTLEWAQKAEADFSAAQLLAQTAAEIHHDVVCFHAQQCIEKYLKAWLQEAGIAFRRTHDLEELLDLVLPAVPAWSVWQSDFVILTTHAVDFRYPGKSASKTDAEHALRVCDDVRTKIRANLQLPP